MSSTESRSSRTLRLLKRFSGTIEKFEKTLVHSNKKQGYDAVVVRRVAAKSCESNALPAADALLMKRQKLENDLFCPNTSDKTEGRALVRRVAAIDHKPVRRVAAKSCESNVLPAADALLMKRQKLEKDLFCPNTSDKTEVRALVRRVAAIDHKPVRRSPSANEGHAGGRCVAAKCESNALPADALLMRKKRNEEEMERNNLKRREAIQKKREAARREIAQMQNTSGIYDPLELVRDLEKMLGYSITGYMPQPALPLPDYYINKQCEMKSLMEPDDTICCCEDHKRVEEVEEGEIVKNFFSATTKT